MTRYVLQQSFPVAVYLPKNTSPYWIVVEEKHNINIIYDLKSVCSSIEINWGESHFLFTNAIFIQANEN